MKCPFCKNILDYGELKEYQTTFEHVFDPNAESFLLRITYVCNCPESHDCYWGNNGEFYVGKNSIWIGKYIAINTDAISE